MARFVCYNIGRKSRGDRMQESRMFKIVYYLLDKGKATAPELSKHFEVSVRTIYRDIDAISSAGIPIYAEVGRSGGIRLYDDFVLDKVVLSENEKQEILNALQSLAIVGSENEKATLTKLSALFQIYSENWYEVDFSRWGEKAQDNTKFNDLRFAILQHRAVSIAYVGSNQKRSHRIVYPYKLLYKAKAWYLKACCKEEQTMRTFKLNRIVDYTVLEELFEPIAIKESQSMPEQNLQEIQLHFSKEVAYRVYDEFDDSQIQIQADDSLLVCAHMPENSWLICFLLSFGVDVSIVKPKYLTSILAQKAKEIYEKNKT